MGAVLLVGVVARLEFLTTRMLFSSGATEVQPNDDATTFTPPPPLPTLPPMDVTEHRDGNADAADAVTDAVANGAASKTSTGSGKRLKSRRTGKTNKTKNSTNRERGSVTKSIKKIASLIVDGKSDDLHQFMLMRKMEDEAEERKSGVGRNE
jgi:hypothetical protein